MLTSNNYLGFANHPRVREAQKKAIDRWGAGMASVRFICGTEALHKELEAEIASFFGKDDAILYMSCWNANEGLFPAILEEPDGLYSDELNHASIIDGVRLCKAKRYRVPHSDMQAFEKMLAEDTTSRFRLMMTDGVFSMEGEEARPARSRPDLRRERRAPGRGRLPRDRRPRPDRPRHGRGAGRDGQDRRLHRHARQGDGLGRGRIHDGTEGPGRDASPEKPAVPLLELPSALGRGGVARSRSGCCARTRRRSASSPPTRLTSERPSPNRASRSRTELIRSFP